MLDALSDILRTVRLRSSVYFRKEFSAPWGMEVDAGAFAQFHMLVRGQCWVKTQQLSEPLALAGGDIVVFPHGDAHWLAADPDHERLPGKQVVEAIWNDRPVFEGDGASATLVCGHFEFDRGFDHPLLKALPGLIHITDMERRESSWLETATNVIIHEAGSQQPGADVVVERLAEVLFIQILRTYMRQQGQAGGFFAALQDEQINRALALIHTEPEAGWTLEKIARSIGMSRSAFAVRFKQLVGATPMDYITSWRMNKARELLRNARMPLIDIAERVGYTSEAAFNRAFKRKFQQNPGAMRRSLLQS